MEKYFVAVLAIVIIVLTYPVPSQRMDQPSNITSFAASARKYKKEFKVLRQGINTDENPQPSHHDTPQHHDCVCSKIYDPVCASNNQSYFNICFLECRVPKSMNVTVVHQGNCIPF